MNWINFNPLPKFFKNENVKSSCKEDCSRIQSSSLKGKSWRSQDLFKSFREISKRQVHNENLEPTQTTKTNTLWMNEWLSKLVFFFWNIYLYIKELLEMCLNLCDGYCRENHYSDQWKVMYEVTDSNHHVLWLCTWKRFLIGKYSSLTCLLTVEDDRTKKYWSPQWPAA